MNFTENERFRTDRPCKVSFLIRHDDVQSAACLVDVSRSGAKLLLPERLTLDGLRHVELVLPQLGTVLNLEANLAWQDSHQQATRVGCEFLRDLPTLIWNMLAGEGKADRRCETLAVKIAWRGHTGLDAEIVSFSPGGLSLLCKDAPPRNTYVSLLMGGQVLRVLPKWTRWCSEGHLLGCSFISSPDSWRFGEMMKTMVLRNVLETAAADAAGLQPKPASC